MSSIAGTPARSASTTALRPATNSPPPLGRALFWRGARSRVSFEAAFLRLAAA
ncbi:unannotated protein [freshwater metagenome]|uniref:Unannotated protein n=1 Tax=freshwater metagenome TaxID=449393 RepID=A0A6J6Q8M3_9ZZZZ